MPVIVHKVKKFTVRAVLHEEEVVIGIGQQIKQMDNARMGEPPENVDFVLEAHPKGRGPQALTGDDFARAKGQLRRISGNAHKGGRTEANGLAESVWANGREAGSSLELLQPLRGALGHSELIERYGRV
jgi:hypothetical protein